MTNAFNPIIYNNTPTNASDAPDEMITRNRYNALE